MSSEGQKMILPIFGHLLPNNAGIEIGKNVKNDQKPQPKRHTESMRRAQNFEYFSNAENRQFMSKCIVFNQWFVDRVNTEVCVQTIENGTVILEGLL
jgi:hypothetical protein